MPERDWGIEWEKATCPNCGEVYSYPKGGYKPPTCSKYECLHKYLHPQLYRRKN